MAVKVCINGQMKKIDTTLHKPVIFLNGQKKVLDKAWTFINGEKIQLWGKEGVQIDYIRANGLLSGQNKIVAIGEDWAVVNSAGTYYDYVNRVDISNLSNPSLVQQVAWGTVTPNGYNGFRSSGDGWYFNASTSVGQTSSGNELNINPSTGVVSINRTYSTTDINGAPFAGVNNSYFMFCSVETYYYTIGNRRIRMAYGSRFCFNNVQRYTIGTTSDSHYVTQPGYPVQINAGDFLLKTTKGTYLANYSGITQKTSTQLNLFMLDGDDVLCKDGDNVIKFLNKSSLAVSKTYTAASGYNVVFVGRNGTYYYFVEYKSDDAKLRVVKQSDMSLAFEESLPVDPFNDGVDFWATCTTVPQITKSGYLGVSGSVTGNLRIVRFSELL